MQLAPLSNDVEKRPQSLALLDSVMRPDRREVPFGTEHAEEIFQTPGSAVGCPQRVSFEVEEEIETGVVDTTEISEARWLCMEELVKLPCNVDVNKFIERLRHL